MIEWMDSALGTVFYSIVVFMVGSIVGPHLWCWTKNKCPFMCKQCK